MSNTQSNDLLRELNAKLLAEISKLRKKFAEIGVEKTELKFRIAGLLKQAVEESKRRDIENARIEELEKNKANSSFVNVSRDVEIAEIKVEVRDNNEENKELIQDISLEDVVNVPSSIVDQPINVNPIDTHQGKIERPMNF